MTDIQQQLKELLDSASRLNQAQYRQEKHMLMLEYSLQQRDLDTTAARLHLAATAHAEWDQRIAGNAERQTSDGEQPASEL